MIKKTTETGGAGRLKLLTKRQSVRLEQSLTKAWNSKTSLFGHTSRLRILVTYTHYKLWYLFVYFGIFHPKYVTTIVLCLDLSKIMFINFYSVLLK